jgi:molybdenum cofactor guanylyltransferase
MNAFVLAGGQSQRMKRDKALLRLADVSLVQLGLEKLRSLGFLPQIVGTRPDLESFAPVIYDNYPNAGPLGGIEAALAASHEELNFFLPVDLPLLPIQLLGLFMDRALLTDASATIPCINGRPQPICAVYSRSLLPQVQKALLAGNRKVMQVLQSAAENTKPSIDIFDLETVTSSKNWTPWTPLYRCFENLNTPADFEKVSLEKIPRIQYS